MKLEQKKNLSRYHFVRFIERQKSERQLARLVRQRDSCQDDQRRSELDKQVHVTEVDLNYAKYAPLGGKYISLFPTSKSSTNGPKSKKRDPKLEELERELAVLSEEQRDELRLARNEEANVAKMAGDRKPPLWYVVERLMAEGGTQLEALRDGKLTSKITLAAVGGREESKARKGIDQDLEAPKPDWLTDNGVIDPADLDTDQEDDVDMSDGGFFER
jgi:hypothetical protein